MADVVEEIKGLARDAEQALAAAVRHPSAKAAGAYERKANRLHKACGGHLPDGGRGIDKRARGELYHGVPGEACKACGDYLRRMAGEAPALRVVEGEAKPGKGKAAESGKGA